MRWGDGEAALFQESDLCFLFLRELGGCSFFFKKDERVATASLLERIGLGFFCFLFFYEKLPPSSIFFSSSCISLNVHLYRKSLYVIFKEILQ